MDIKTAIYSWGMVFASAFLNSCANLLLKGEIKRLGDISFDGIANALSSFGRLMATPAGGGGIFLLFAGAAFWMAGLSKMDVSAAVPVSMTLNLLLATLGGLAFFGEVISINKIIGMVLIMASFYFLSD
jgi:multidrug transporter EmrE-like cation transporter